MTDTATPAAPTTKAHAIEEGQLRASDGTRLFFRRAAPAGSDRARARVLLVHGFAEHSGRYSYVLGQLAGKGYDTWAIDLRGYGKSDGGRGCINSFDEYLDDVTALLAATKPDQSSPPTFLLGHSMGGLVATRFVQERPAGIKGVILSSPFYRVKMPVPAVKRIAARILSVIAPRLALATNLDAEHLSRDPAIVKAYVADPLVLTKATTRWFTETTRSQQLAYVKAKATTLPTLLIHGATDGLVDPEASRELFGLLGAPDKTLKLWPELRHEILNEPEKDQVLAMMTDWIEKHLA